MLKVSMARAREQLSEIAQKVQHRGERCMFTHYNKPVVALISAEELELFEMLLEKYEDDLSAQAYESRKDEESVSAEDAWKELGL